MINYQPKRGLILMCDYDMAHVPPEMRKVRRAIVVSPRSYNRLHRERDGTPKPGKCIVVPVSAKAPRKVLPSQVPIPSGRYGSLTVPTWVICDMVSHVSFARLQTYKTEYITDADMALIDTALRHALGLP